MSTARKVSHSLVFNGKNVSEVLKDYIETLTYTDPAEGGSDELSITMQNIDGKWLKEWYPQKGSTIKGEFIFTNWTKDGDTKKLDCGKLTLDEIKMDMLPMTASLSCLSAPTTESFKVRDRDKTWEKVTIQNIASEICKRYKMKLSYSGPSIQIEKLEQSTNDSSFLSKLCDDYGLSMKIYRSKIVIYDMTEMEKKPAVSSLKLSECESLSFTDGIYGTYTGAEISYKSSDDDSKEISVLVGKKKSGGRSRILRINETCDSEADARRKGAAKVNKANRQETTLSANIFPDPKICAGVCLTLGAEFGKLKGKYFVDKVRWSVGNSGTTQSIDAHKVVKKVKA